MLARAQLVGLKTALERTLDDWLLIVDNADNTDLIFGDDGMSLRNCLPFSRRGTILMMTRVHEVAVRLDVPMRNTFALAEMSEAEATQMLRTSLSEKQMRDGASTRGLLDYLARLPLAVKRTSAYMAQTGISTANRDFEDRGRYRETANPNATTWLISFRRMTQRCSAAAEYRKLICFLAEKDIPLSLLRDNEAEMPSWCVVMRLVRHDALAMHNLASVTSIRTLSAGPKTLPELLHFLC
ncbi:hypothetical protein JX266_013910 [Neoarthrinium moseri]|uniref:uncharacterized protein n=1 Tax=Neoarthrinium moseri TaxID=1658444 RepID=UPI001FDC02D0|nr:uncharacterized protein JN550_013370 [Neoarthrinium moseri]KAI1839878.1 hypothetical protein JX266_013910 [Neoarthrinium moseri]KAI1857235.1 hypothetical protein JN550_013370 [Neoarthrinium moseri]